MHMWVAYWKIDNITAVMIIYALRSYYTLREMQKLVSLKAGSYFTWKWMQSEFDVPNSRRMICASWNVFKFCEPLAWIFAVNHCWRHKFRFASLLREVWTSLFSYNPGHNYLECLYIPCCSIWSNSWRVTLCLLGTKRCGCPETGWPIVMMWCVTSCLAELAL